MHEWTPVSTYALIHVNIQIHIDMQTNTLQIFVLVFGEAVSLLFSFGI